MQVQIAKLNLLNCLLTVDDLLKSFQAYQHSRQVGFTRKPTGVTDWYLSRRQRLFDLSFRMVLSAAMHLVIKPKRNMKIDWPCLIDHQHYLKKRALIESVNDLLVSVCDVEHTRHRKPENAFAHIAGALIAYQCLDHKSAMFIPTQQPIHCMAA